MSVTKAGPSGYHYQYLTGLYLYLFYRSFKTVKSVIIDSKGKGDICLVFKEKGIDVQFEFECKERKPALNKNYFLKCITKFDPYSNDLYVLSKLNDKVTDEYFIITSARAEQFCEDLSIIANNTNLVKHQQKRTKKVLKEFTEAVIKCQADSDVRNKFVENHLKKLNIEEIELLLDKITIVDQLDAFSIREKIGILLSKSKVAVSYQETLVLQLLEIIRNSSGTDYNILDDLNSLIDKNLSFQPEIFQPYVKIGNEDILLDELKKNKLLLLSGASLCGKTQRCHQVVRELHNEFPGFSYFITSDIRAAEQFVFSGRQEEGRICYLEDPIGQYPSDIDYGEVKKLENFVRKISPNRDHYLICTATLQLTDKLSASGCLSAYNWHDLTLTDKSKAFEIWSQLTDSGKKVPAQLNKLVRQAISFSSDKDMLQPGQLAFLSRGGSYRSIPSTLDELRHLAQFNAQSITDLIKRDPNLIQAMEILALGASTNFGPLQVDLEYIDADEKDYFPGINKINSSNSGIAIGKSADYKIAEYKVQSNVNKAFLNSVSNLIDLGYLTTYGEQFVFAHPVYQEAARKLWSGDNPMRFTASLRKIKMIVGCLNPKMALQGVRNLYLLFKNTSKTSDHQEIIAIAEMAANSTFVIVRDEAALFLISCFDFLNAESKDRLRSIFENRFEYGSTKYFWKDNIVFVPDFKHIEVGWFGNECLSKKDTQNAWADFMEDVRLLPVETAALMLKSMIRASRTNPQPLCYEIKAIKTFLNYDEAFIREFAAYLLAASINIDTFNELKEIYYENDAFVKFQLIKGLFRSYPYLKDKSKQKEIFDFMRSIFDDRFVSYGAVTFFTQFSAGYTSATFDWWYEVKPTARRPMWYLWGELMPILFKYLPSDIRINNGRFHNTLNEALVTDICKTNLLNAFIDWLKVYFKDPDRRSGLGEVFFSFFDENFEKIKRIKRLEMIKSLLEFDDKSFQSSIINQLVSKSKLLNKKELKLVLEKIRTSCLMAKVMAFTNSEANDEVQMAALGYVTKDKNANEVIEMIPDNLMGDIIYTTYLNYSVQSYSNINKVLWDSILKYYLEHPEQKNFTLAVLVFFEDIFKLQSTRNGLWINHEKIFEAIVKDCDDTNLKFMSLLLILQLMNDRYTESDTFLSTMYETKNTDLINFIQKHIIDNIECISNASNLDLLKNLITLDSINKNLYFDLFINKIFELGFDNTDDEDLETSTSTVITFALESRNLRLSKSFDIVEHWYSIKKTSLDSRLAEVINSSSTAFIEKCQAQEEEMELQIKSIFEECIGRTDLQIYL
ncbi:hypothetical protein HYN56_11350 [Flavobacterium crocinum]|uniref:Novel STAND NTPase 3 domain-containing protein n=1 Tax=Flavobacterium crocinum TaxID=2183896 RepID=A0A2S1YL27_9FLAO|nr:hypothetical protein [Flavobacterium crocinum]AWK04787.1 hypothetical protein HYN56_11350 [Flavobacterium crocinum]